MSLSARERLKYRKIDWLMPAVDVVSVLERMGAERISVHGDEVQCLCPDHHLFVDRESSHPNWICNTKTGMTYCRTEPRGSNFLWTVCRTMSCEPSEAVEFMTGMDASRIQTAVLLNKISKYGRENNDEEYKPVDLDNIEADIKDRYMSDACYDYFMSPPGKPATNITKDTVDSYQVFERKWGRYSNRAVIPFFMRGEIVGFCAIDLLGKDRWLIEHPLKEEDDYRKTLYPFNFKAVDCLFGFDDCEKNCESLTITEGAREVMKLKQEGFPNTVGCLKADVSENQIYLLAELAPKEIILMFDGDDAGYRATDKNYEKLSQVFPVRRCYLRIGCDPKALSQNEIKNCHKRAK